MQVAVTGKNMDVTDALKERAKKKLQKLDKYFYKELEARVLLEVERGFHKAEILIPFRDILFRAEEATPDMYVSIDNAVDKIEKQILKYKTRLEKRFSSGDSIRYADLPQGPKEEEEGFEVVRTKKISIKPMSVEEAILQMNLLGHDFFVFTNEETDDVAVVYKRKDGRYGLIEPNEE
ncbi:ribosome hibernation-promoting factor, HPF/YfiA family [Calorimonas adulescens]|uniref:Ribosome hibernation promoting factor n=1 Tax=Calorimonas adulescens TaxID=2606906 RepID=A0A5D8QDQ5_9THEO|nr:ribosome-associated translation inhibitor RaiA [Calorimonas adulescens]TZE82642.1 ribosome-associated translation inhibitor RaiA [Calorimonas adulescens]